LPSAPDQPEASAVETELVRVAGYEVLGLLGAGGMGVVYKARQTALRRIVALKKVRSGGFASEDELRRFQAEAEAVAQLQHPNIVQVYEVGQHDGLPYFSLEFCAGGSLEKQLDGTPWEPGRAAALVEVLAGAMQAAHQVGIIHRDLKPGNVLLTGDGTPKVTDFGLVKRLDVPGHTQSNAVVGTPPYMPPEQAGAWGGQVGPTADVYSLGAILYELLTGRPPFKAANALETVLQVVSDEPVPVRRLQPKVPKDLETICLKCLEKDPRKRYASSAALAADLRRFLNGEPVQARPVGALVRLWKWARRRPALAALVLAALAGVGAVLFVQYRANVQLAAKNAELARQQAEVEDRFELAQKAIATFHTGVSEEALLAHPEFTELRSRLLKEAAYFYRDLEKLLVGKTDPKSRQLLARGYYQLAELTKKIGDRKAALAVHQKALAVRRELAAAPGADVEARLDVARSLLDVGGLLAGMDDRAAALAAYEEQRDIALALEAEAPTDAVRSLLSRSYGGIGFVQTRNGDQARALEAYQKALDIHQALADAHPDNIWCQSDLAWSHNAIAGLLADAGKVGEALQAFEKALAARKKLAAANPGVARFQRDLAASHANLGVLLWATGKLGRALQAHEQALAIQQKLAKASPADTQLQSDLANSHNNIAAVLSHMGKAAESLQQHQKTRDLRQQLADANPSVTEFQSDLAQSYNNIGWQLLQTGKLEEAVQALEKALAINQKLAHANPAAPDIQRALAQGYNNVGMIHIRQKDYPRALAAIDKGLETGKQLAAAYSKSGEYGAVLGASYCLRGWARVRSGQPAGAAADLRRALELWGKGNSLGTLTRFERSRALALLAGLSKEANSGVTAAEAAAFADQAVAALRDAIQAGWGTPDELKEPDFDPIRKRDDFQKLLKELQARKKG
jgi:serine/threonine-protein kinase